MNVGARFDFFIPLDRSGPVPLYFQLASRLERAILDGELPPGARIENEISLGARLGLSRVTVRRAIQELVEKGFLVRRRGIGTQVLHGRLTRKIGLRGLYEDLENDGREPSTQLLDRKTMEASVAVANRLGIGVGEPVLYLRRLRLSGGDPVAIMQNYIQREFESITDEQLMTHGLYQLMRERGATMKVARQTIGARHPSAEEGKLLRMFSSDPLLTMDTITYDQSGVSIEIGYHAYRPNLYDIEVTIIDR